MKTILLVDDDELIRSIFGTALEQLGYRAIVAASGAEGLELARKHIPDLILSDINMPGTDGCTLLQSLRADPELASKQVVLMTGRRMEAMQRTTMNLGADDFLLKPFSPEELDRCISARLRRADVSRRVEDKMIQSLQNSLHASLPHEFFTPLAGILGLVEILQGDIAQLKDHEVQEILSDIQLSGRRLHRTLRNYLMLLDPTNVQTPTADALSLLAPAAVEATILSAAKTSADRNGRPNDIRMEIASCPLLGSPNEIAIMAEELTENACIFSRKGTRIDVRLTADGMLTVRDSGRGMTPEELNQYSAFRQFDRHKFEQQGLGLGLALVHRLATRQSATFEIESEPGVGTTATIRFKTSN